MPDREAIVHGDGRLTYGQLLERVDRLAARARRAGLGVPPRAGRAGAVGVGPGPPRALPPQRPRVPRGHARRLHGPGGAVQRELPLRRRGAAVPAQRLRRPGASSTTRRSRRVLAEVRAELPELAGAAPGAPTTRATTCCPTAPSGTRTRWPRVHAARPGRRRPRPTTSTSSTPAAPRHAQGRAVAPGRHLPGRPRRPRSSAPARSGPTSTPSSRTPATAAPSCMPAAAVHARRRPLAGLQRASPAATPSCCPEHHRRLDPADVWSTVEREAVNILLIVGDAFGRPLLDELDRARLRPLVAAAARQRRRRR